MAEMERSYIVYAIIVIVLLGVIALVVLQFYPGILEEVGKIADETFGIIPKEEAETVESLQKLVSAVEACLSTSNVRCGCKLDSRQLPENYFIIIKNTPEGATFSLLSREDMVIGSSKRIPNAKMGILLPAYNSRNAIFSNTILNVIDGICLYDKDLRLVGNSDDVISTEIGDDEGIFYADSDSRYRALPALFKVNDNTVCLVTTDLQQDDLSENGLKIHEDVYQIQDKEIVYPAEEITKNGRLRTSGLEIDDVGDIEILAASYLQSKEYCTESEFRWPFEADFLVSSCSLEVPSGNLASTYTIDLQQGTDVLAQSNSEVSSYCDTDCSPGEKWVELKQTREIISGIRGIFNFKYSGLISVEETITSAQGLRVRKGQPIGKSSGKAKITITDARGKAVHPGCIFPALTSNHYTSSCACPGKDGSTEPCNMDSQSYFYNCWR